MRSMSDSARITFDTNILVYAGVDDASPRHQIARHLLARASGANCVLALQSLAEFVGVATRKARIPLADASRIVEVWLEIFPAVHASAETLRSALSGAVRHRLSFWDAMLWAVAREAGCRYLLSEDFQSVRTLLGVTFVNPFAPAGLPAEVERLLGPPQR
jgi:predicted nucleic acid-binding protein